MQFDKAWSDFIEVVSVFELTDRDVILLWPLVRLLSDWWCHLDTRQTQLSRSLATVLCCCQAHRSYQLNILAILSSYIKGVFATIDPLPLFFLVCLYSLCTVAVRIIVITGYIWKGQQRKVPNDLALNLMGSALICEAEEQRIDG